MLFGAFRLFLISVCSGLWATLLPRNPASIGNGAKLRRWIMIAARRDVNKKSSCTLAAKHIPRFVSIIAFCRLLPIWIPHRLLPGIAFSKALARCEVENKRIIVITIKSFITSPESASLLHCLYQTQKYFYHFNSAHRLATSSAFSLELNADIRK